MDNLHCSPESECNSLFSVIKLNAAYLGFLFSANPLGDLFFMPPFTPSQKINKKKTINKTKKNMNFKNYLTETYVYLHFFFFQKEPMPINTAH